MVPTAVLTLGILQRHRGRSDPIDVGNPFVVYCCYKRRCRSSKCLAHPSGLCRLFFKEGFLLPSPSKSGRSDGFALLYFKMRGVRQRWTMKPGNAPCNGQVLRLPFQVGDGKIRGTQSIQTGCERIPQKSVESAKGRIRSQGGFWFSMCSLDFAVTILLIVLHSFRQSLQHFFHQALHVASQCKDIGLAMRDAGSGRFLPTGVVAFVMASTGVLTTGTSRFHVDHERGELFTMTAISHCFNGEIWWVASKMSTFISVFISFQEVWRDQSSKVEKVWRYFLRMVVVLAAHGYVIWTALVINKF